MDFQAYKTRLEQAGVTFDAGLTSDEIQQIESRYQFRFPPDYREFLMFALPISDDFIDWRHDAPTVKDRLSWPYEGMCFDIEVNNFWLREWGPRPVNKAEAFAIARQAIERAPTLIPIFGHRFIPDRPAERGNPIFSVVQTDIIYYGGDLEDYLQNEFRQAFGREEYRIEEPIKQIEFWSYLVYLNYAEVDDGQE